MTLPFPVPAAPDAIVIHETLLAAVHAHVLVVETVADPVPSLAETLSLVGEIEYVQAGGGGAGGAGGAGVGGAGGGVLAT
jgi:hypothetical protein